MTGPTDEPLAGDDAESLRGSGHDQKLERNN